MQRDKLQWGAFGALCAFGTYGNMALVADPATVAWAVIAWTSHRRRPPLWAVLLSATILLTGAWSDNPLNTGLFAARLLALSTLYVNLGPRSRGAMVLGATAILIPQSAALLWTIDEFRPRGLSANASQASSTGLMLWMAAPLSGWGWLATSAAIAHLGVGLGRTALLAAALFGLATFSRRRMAAGIALGLLISLSATLQEEWNRFSPGPAAGGTSPQRTVAIRNELLVAPTPSPDPTRSPGPKAVPTPSAVPAPTVGSTAAAGIVPTAAPQEPTGVVASAAPGTYVCYGGDCRRPSDALINVRILSRRLVPAPLVSAIFARERLHGYGWGSYGASTGQLRPHNGIVLTWYEMGLFSVVPFGILLWALRKEFFPWRFWLPLLALSMLTEEMTGRPEGFYMLAIVVAAHLRPAPAGPIGRHANTFLRRARARLSATERRSAGQWIPGRVATLGSQFRSGYSRFSISALRSRKRPLQRPRS